MSRRPPATAVTVGGEVVDWQRVDALIQRTPSGHWLWMGSLSREGYGRLNNLYVHRLTYARERGPIPDGMEIDHLCRTRACCNPVHLEAVTPLVNWLRGEARGAVSVRTGRCIRGHEWTPENTYLRPDGAGRNCLACIRLRTARKAKR